MFEAEYNSLQWEEAADRIYSSTEEDLQRVLGGDRISIADLYPLFSPAADNFLEDLAAESYRITRMRFGNTVQLYTPLYISNECSNSCIYCGFNVTNNIRRITLTREQIMDEADLIYRSGFRHILLLTGENRKAVPVETLASIASDIHRRFASVSVEVYPMDMEEYGLLVQSGVDGLTIYQETYNKVTYDTVHRKGKKKDFYWRLNTPDRGGMAGLRRLGIGALLGLSDWRVDGFYTALHALYLSKTYWKSHIQVSFPRLRNAPGGFIPLCEVSDRDLTHLICAMRIIMPDTGLVLSTREPAGLRDNLLPLGITMMSAGSKTEPGGYGGLNVADGQFDTSDKRSPGEIMEMIKNKGFDPVWKDWDRDFLS